MSEAGTRTVPVDDFYVGFLIPCMAADELLVGIHFDRPPMGASLTEFSCRRCDFVIVAVPASLASSPYGRCTAARIGVGRVARFPFRLLDEDAALVSAPLARQDIVEISNLDG